MKKIKKYIIISICIIVILIIAIIIKNLLEKNNNSSNSIEVYNIEKVEKIDMSQVKDISEYASIEKIVNIYNTAINQLDPNLESMMVKLQNGINSEDIKNEYSKKAKKTLENILQNEFTNINNWESKLSKYSNNKFYINEMKKYSINNIDIYLVNITYDKTNNTNIVIFKDTSTFSILPSEYLNNRNIEESNILDVIKELNITQINKNNENVITEFNLTDEKACLKYYYDYLNMLRSDTDKLYSTLDKDYREKRFGNIENFKNYINENKEKLEKAVLLSYKVKDRGKYIEYMCVDKSENYYIFNATAAMKYTIYLDTYTVDLPEFKEKYEKANDKEKVILNTGKIIAAINNQDYKYVYSKLAESFKQNKINSEESLKEILQKNIYRKNEIKVDEVEREGNIYTCKARIIKKDEDGEEIPEGKDAPSKNFNIVMQLKEGSDFVMSFSVKD